MKTHTIKTCGYLVSTLSVLLLGIVSWKKASQDLLLLLCLIGGMLTSIVGMMLRWLSYHIEKRKRPEAVESSEILDRKAQRAGAKT